MLGGGGGGKAPGTEDVWSRGVSDQSKKGGMMDKIKKGMFGGGDKSKGGDMVPDVDPKEGDKFKEVFRCV